MQILTDPVLQVCKWYIFFMVNLLRLSSSWSAADQCELVRGDTPLTNAN